MGTKSSTGSNASFGYSVALIAFVCDASNSVYPSGAARATISLPIIAPAPGRLSITTCWPQRFDNSCAMIRIGPSTAPPGENGTMTRTTRDGNVCARAKPDVAVTSTAMKTQAARTDKGLRCIALW